jgi:hypothetical protein
MNKRIKELWEESTGATIPAEGYYSSASKYNIEKFSELIIKECIDTIVRDTANYPGVGMMAYYQGVQDAGKSIKQHFGVEE